MLPRRSRRLRVRFGFFSPSLKGGVPLLLLFSPSRRSWSLWRRAHQAAAQKSHIKQKLQL